MSFFLCSFVLPFCPSRRPGSLPRNRPRLLLDVWPVRILWNEIEDSCQRRCPMADQPSRESITVQAATPAQPFRLGGRPKIDDWDAFYQLLLSGKLNHYGGHFVVIHHGRSSHRAAIRKNSDKGRPSTSTSPPPTSSCRSLTIKNVSPGISPTTCRCSSWFTFVPRDRIWELR